MRSMAIFILLLCLATTTAGASNAGDFESSHRTGCFYQKLTETPLIHQVHSVRPSSALTDLSGTLSYTLQAVDNTAGIPPVGNQGMQGSCMGWAVGYYHLTHEIWREQGWDVNTSIHQFSPAFIYNHINGGVDIGSYPEDALDHVIRHGCCTMYDMPYLTLNYSKWPAESVYENALQFRAASASWVDISTTEGLNTLKQHIANGRTACLGLFIYDNFDNISNYNNTYTLADKTGTNDGGHPAVIVGYDDNRVTNDGVGAFRLVNSWGIYWGDGGYFWMSYQAAMSSELSFQQAWYLNRDPDYAPELAGRFKITHSRRGQIVRNAGLTVGVGTSAWSMPVFHYPYIQAELASRGLTYQGYAFPTNNIVVDLTEGAPYIEADIDRRIFLSATDSIAATTGTIDYFAAAYIEPPIGAVCSQTPKSITDNSVPTVVDLVISWNLPGTLAGYVRDTGNNALEGASIVLTPGNFSADSQWNGYYSVPDVPARQYDVSVYKSGFLPVIQTGVTISVGMTTNLNVQLTPTNSIRSAKSTSDGANVTVNGIVTAKFPRGSAHDLIYVENEERSCGIAVSTSAAVDIGDELLVQGTMTTTGKERVVSATSVSIVRKGLLVPKPLAATNRALGGGSQGLQSAVLDDSASDRHSVEASNIGLLVKTWGRVTHVNTSGGYFYLNDGSDLRDGSGYVGVRVGCPLLPRPNSGAYVQVTGISGISELNGEPVRTLRPRSLSDLSYYTYANYVTNPGFEYGSLAGWTIYGSIDGVQSGTWFGGITPHSGNWFVGSAASGGMKLGGVYQRISVPAPLLYRATAWSRVYRSENPTDSTQNRVGLDPTGGTDQYGTTVAWSPMDSQPVDWYSEWHQLSTPVVTCANGWATVFLEMRQMYSTGWHVNCFDDAVLEVQ